MFYQFETNNFFLTFKVSHWLLHVRHRPRPQYLDSSFVPTWCPYWCTLAGDSRIMVPTCTTTLLHNFNFVSGASALVAIEPWLMCLPPVPAVSSQPVSNLKWSAGPCNRNRSRDWRAARPCQSFQVSLSATWNGPPVHECLRQSVTGCLGNYPPSVAFAVARERQQL